MQFNGHKNSILQSKELDGLVYLDPPKEANVPPGYIRKLSKCVYGLIDSSRSWSLTLGLVYLDPPKEANVPPGYIWKLSKCVYGLIDSSRSWYLTLGEKLLKSGAVV